MYITSDEEINGAEVYYADASKPVLKWKKAYAPVYDSVNGRYSTSIIGLEENTEYYVRAVAQKSGNNEIYLPRILRRIRVWRTYTAEAEHLL